MQQFYTNYFPLSSSMVSEVIFSPDEIKLTIKLNKNKHKKFVFSIYNLCNIHSKMRSDQKRKIILYYTECLYNLFGKIKIFAKKKGSNYLQDVAKIK